MNILSWIFFGLIAGSIAKLLMPGKTEPKGCISTMILGIVGALVGGFIGSKFLGTGHVDDWSLGSFAIAVGGAVLVLWVFAMIKRRN
ncbi:MAG TPA: GlsB/YeaQ/YmgE family stress response membrane protein [Edaphocola sp.]|nr:GlsB/YeaQ/YmgE family stress response membrane protein [Edaphocola sp.]